MKQENTNDLEQNIRQHESSLEKIRQTVSLAAVFFVLLGGLILCLLHQPEEISVSERRKLAQFPALSGREVIGGRWMDKFEDYTLDQFPFRESLRRVKAYVEKDVFQKKDNNGIYLADGSACKLDYPLKENSVIHAAEKFNSLYETYMAGSNVKIYLSVVPDKNYFLAEKNGYPSIDYERMIKLLRENLNSEIAYLDLFSCLSADDYYRTDSHWSQEKVVSAAQVIAEGMGAFDRISGKYEEKTLFPFYGVYYGQSALALKPDTIHYLTGEVIESCTVYNAETGKTAPVYDLDRFNGTDPYDVFLSGAAPLLVITNPAGEKGKELVLFRDSFGSSLAPLLIEAYEKITLIDIRYMRSELIPQYITFEDQDVLFLYSTTVLNSSNILR